MEQQMKLIKREDGLVLNLASAVTLMELESGDLIVGYPGEEYYKVDDLSIGQAAGNINMKREWRTWSQVK
jgi:hypothetical protein